jgi:hypothetical protein
MPCQVQLVPSQVYFAQSLTGGPLHSTRTYIEHFRPILKPLTRGLAPLREWPVTSSRQGRMALPESPVLRQAWLAKAEERSDVSGDARKDGPGPAGLRSGPRDNLSDDLAEALPAGLRRAADLSQLRDPRLLRALAWWQGLRDPGQTSPGQTGNDIPDRARLDPGEIPDLLPHAILWDVLAATDEDGLPADRLLYRCRLAGTMLNDFYGREARGQWLHEQYGDESAAMQAEYDAAVRLRRPLWAEHRMSWADKPYYRYLRLMLPFTHRAAAGRSDTPALRSDPDRVALIFNVISFIGE